ncbi:MAG: DUF4331 family protein [Polyangiaceae bacterium]
MNKKWTLAALAIPVIGAGIAVMTPGRAADHIDSPGATADKAADITDVYTFVSPTTTNHLVMIMDVTPTASAASKFSDKVEYYFRAHSITNAGTLAVGPDLGFKCTFDATAGMTCTGGGGLTKTVAFNATTTCGSGDDICLFAGLRSDPFFFDFGAFQAVLKTGDASALNSGKSFPACDGGTNFFDGFNVLSIILEVNSQKAFNPGDAASIPLLTVSADTKRTGN